MRTIQTALLAGVAAVACAGVAAMAQSPAAQPSRIHVLNVQLPDGSSEQIGYSGDIAPQIIVSTGVADVAALPPLPSAATADATSPAAMLARMSAEMDRQMAVIMARVRAMPLPPLAVPSGLQQAELGKLPPGAQSYSVLSSISGGRACTRSVEVTSQGANRPPQVITRTSGDCAGQTGAISHAAPTAAPDVTHEHAAGKVI